MDYFLGSEGILNVTEGIKLIDCNEKADSDHQGFLVDLNLELNFEEEFNKEHEIEKRLLNPNERCHGKVLSKFVKNN